MKQTAEVCDVAIVGGGPVGLYLGTRLLQQGLDVRVLERSVQAKRGVQHARAIGVHPRSLDLLARMGLARALIARGVPVRRARVLVGERPLASLDFAALPGEHRFVLSVPQPETEGVLRAELCAGAPQALVSGACVEALTQRAEGVSLHVRREGTFETLKARLVVGADGKHSLVRRALGIAFEGASYGRHFVMGDGPDPSPLGDEAAIQLHPKGLLESFPLPCGKRRFVAEWRAEAGPPQSERAAQYLAHAVAERVGYRFVAETATLSTFTPEHYLARRFHQGRVVLIGDAAHVLSPIGGQGMNLGFLDAERLTRALCAALRDCQRASATLSHYARERRRAACRATQRAEGYMRVAEPSRFCGVRDALLKSALSRWLAPLSARYVTMWGLG